MLSCPLMLCVITHHYLFAHSSKISPGPSFSKRGFFSLVKNSPFSKGKL